RIVLSNPNTVVIASAGSGASGALVAEFSVQATNAGTFSIAVSSIFGNGGAYTQTLARIPGDFVVSPGDEGGPLTNGWKHNGTITLGDLDMWSFDANAGDSIVLRMGSATFNPLIRLYGPNGALVGSAGSGASGFLNVDFATSATNSGT